MRKLLATFALFSAFSNSNAQLASFNCGSDEQCQSLAQYCKVYNDADSQKPSQSFFDKLVKYASNGEVKIKYLINGRLFTYRLNVGSVKTIDESCNHLESIAYGGVQD